MPSLTDPDTTIMVPHEPLSFDDVEPVSSVRLSSKRKSSTRKSREASPEQQEVSPKAKPVVAAPKPTADGDEEDMIELFCFCNPSSGGNMAAQLTDMEIEEIVFSNDAFKGIKPGASFTGVSKVSSPIRTHIFNLKDNENRTKGFSKLQTVVQNSPPETDIRAIACGGDGTVKWLISELKKVGCLSVPIGIIPFGTGNDLARTMQWGGSAPKPLLGVGLSAFRRLVQEFVLATVVSLDVWNVTVRVAEEGGKFMEVKDGKEVEKQIPGGKKVILEEMINYFSIGGDAQTVWGFEKNRHKSQLRNKIEYGIQGGQLALPQKAPRNMDKQVEFISTPAEEDIPYVPSSKALIFQNIPSYGSGMDIWGKPSKPGRKALLSTATPQNYGDGMLELMSVMQPSDLGLMKVTNGLYKGVQRLAQANKYQVELKRLDDAKNESYLQVDGEPLKIVNGEEITIESVYQVKLLRRIHPASKAKLKQSRPSEEILMQGHMFYKKHHLRRKKWHRKFFILHRYNDEVFIEFYSKNRKKLRGKVKALNADTVIQTLAEVKQDRRERKVRYPTHWTPNEATTFRVKNGRMKRMWLCADSVADMNQWIEAISSAYKNPSNDL